MSHMPPHTLSRYKPAGILELLYITLPLMMVTFSTQFMLFCDRLILAHYSTFSMSGASSAGTAFSVFQFSILSIAVISEVFVGQYNGSQQFKRIGAPIWQMIWLSLASAVIFIPLAFILSPHVVPDAFLFEGEPYFFHLMCFCPIYGIIGALSAFYIGRGKVKLVALIVVLGDSLNIFLDILLIFGVEGWLPAMGTTGSAIATNISQCLVATSLFGCFITKKNHRLFRTRSTRLNLPLLKEEVKIGAPNAFAHVAEIGAWAYLFHIVSWLSQNHVIILSIAQNIFLMFQFMSEGLAKGVTTIASNYIGKQRLDLVKQCLKSAFIVHVAIMLVIAIPCFIFPEVIAKAYLHDVASDKYHMFRDIIQEDLEWIWIYLLLDGFMWAIAGVLTAGGDTRFIMIASITTVWLAAILPIYLVTKYISQSLALTWKLTAVYGIINVFVYLWRYRSGRWHQLKLSRG